MIDMKMTSGTLRIIALVILLALGVYFSLIVPALTMRLVALPIGLVFVAAAVALSFYMIRRSRRHGSKTGTDI
jgi:hypothetical protein